MKRIIQGGIAILLSLALVLANINPSLIGGDNMEMSISSVMKTDELEVYAAEDMPFVIVEGASNVIKFGDMIEFGSLSSITLRITSKDDTSPTGTWPGGATVESWGGYDEDIVKVTMTDDKRKGTVEAINPGFTSIWVVVSYNGTLYDLMCQVHVNLEIESIGPNGNPTLNSSSTSNWRGMKRGGIFTSGQTNDEYTLQLSTSDAKDGYDHYLVKMKNVSYQSGVNHSTVSGSVLKYSSALEWESSDHTVCTVDENGIVTAVGAGYAEVTVNTKTSGSSGKKDTVKFIVLVAPTATLVGSQDNRKASFTAVVPNSTFTFDTNAVNASSLYWEIRKDSSSGTLLNIDKNDYMKVDISKHSGVITLSNVKAGIYYIKAMPSEKYKDTPDNMSSLVIRVIVPLFINTNEVLMNVGDSYDILNNSNVTNKDVFTYRITGASNIVSLINNTIIKALSEGVTTVGLFYQATGNIYEGLTIAEKELVESYSGFDYDSEIPIPVKVIDGLTLSPSSVIIYIGGTYQLNATTSNNYETVTWISSNESVAKVSADGVVTGVKAGDAVITATQVINGVTKTASCEVRVVQTVTQITLDPSSKDLEIGNYLTINATVKPATTGAALFWVSSDESIVKVTNSDKLSATVQALKGGTAVITAINKDNIVVGSCFIRVYEPITSITLSESDVTLSIADKWFQLYATVLPAAAQNREVIWKSTDTSVVRVDDNGKVTLVKSGKATIMVTSKENASIMALCSITITKSVSAIKLDTTSKAMYVGETFRLSYTLTPSDASNAGVTWSSTNTAVASVDSTGLVSARSVGSTTIIVRTNEGAYTAMCNITVSRTATAVKLDATKLTLNVGDSYLFETTITPADATDTTLTWESSDTGVAVISKRGKVTAKKAGTCIILVKTKTGSTGYCTVTVYQGATGIEINSQEETISVGDTLELEAVIVPATSSSQGITWKSNNTDVATVNNKGEVKGVSGGVAIITCTAVDGGYIDTCIVTVEELITNIKLNETSIKLGLNKTFKLEADISGEKATNKQVGFSSSNSSIASVNAFGVVKGVKVGTVTITCYAEDGSGAESTCEVEVVRLVTDIALNESYITLIQGKSFTLSATTTPNNATYKTPVWTSSNPEIAIINNKGVITALKAGDCVITATAGDSSGISTICYVRVIAPVSSSGVTPQETEVVMAPGETKTVGISISPNNSTDTYTWSSDNTLVASVDEKTGLITARALGAVNVTVMTESGRKATIKVYVVGLSRTYVELQQYTSLLLKLEVDGSGTSSLKIRWDVDNQEIATITNGYVTARAIGTTTVYAVVNGRRLACTVKVVKIK